MISARKFCQEPGYPVTIFLTYSFDPLFFERVPLDDLSMGGTRRILRLRNSPLNPSCRHQLSRIAPDRLRSARCHGPSRIDVLHLREIKRRK
jgi:hypothetical protein